MAKINADALDLVEQVVRTNKVQKTHKGGRTMGWNVLVAVGDGRGHVGVGLGKARAIPDAIRKGVEDAKKNIMRIPLVDNTIPHETSAQWGASQVLIKPASPGTGVVAGGSVRPILELAGIKDVLAKSLGSRNAINTAWATVRCLKQMKSADSICELRSISPDDLAPWLTERSAAAAPADDGQDGGNVEVLSEQTTGEADAPDQA